MNIIYTITYLDLNIFFSLFFTAFFFLNNGLSQLSSYLFLDIYCGFFNTTTIVIYFLIHCWHINNINDVFILTLHAADLLQSFINPIIYQWFFGYSKYQIILCMNNDVFFSFQLKYFFFPDLLAKIYSKILSDDN